MWIRAEGDHIFIKVIFCVGKTSKQTRSISVFRILDKEASFKNIL